MTADHGWAECPMHGTYRDDERMCPDCFDNAKVMGEGDWSFGSQSETRLSIGDVEQVIEEVEAEILDEDKLGASRNDVVEGTCQRIVRRLRASDSMDGERR